VEQATHGGQGALAVEDLDAEARDLRERIYYRDMAAAAGGTVDETASAADKERLARLTEFRGQHPDPPADPDDPEPPPPPDPSSPHSQTQGARSVTFSARFVRR
jgi:hypothetical protein